MKVIHFLICLSLLMVGVTSCDREHTLPTNPFHLDRLEAPEDLTATWSANKVSLSWKISATANVAQFIVFMSDTTGIKYEKFVPDMNNYVDSSSWTDGSKVDSVYYYYQVAAVDSLMFIGPKSNVASVLVP